MGEYVIGHQAANAQGEEDAGRIEQKHHGGVQSFSGHHSSAASLRGEAPRRTPSSPTGAARVSKGTDT